ncbi:MAG: penicillin-binding transpeptidase domain-containing protein [Phototrophicaceae bacterium]
MQFEREINRLLLFGLLTFALVALVAAYWAVRGAGTILQRDDNPRLFEQQARVVRGDIIDRQGRVIVTTEQNGRQRPQRLYPHEAAHSAMGYYSLRYGTGGVEAIYDDWLSGVTLETSAQDELVRSLLHRPQQGADVRLTFDLDVQQRLHELLEDHTGAAVVLSVPDGGVLGMISQPTFDPATLDANWPQLVEDPGEPFFNRAVQGGYQPGSMIYTLLATTALINGVPLYSEFEDAGEAIYVADLLLECTIEPPADTLTLAEAYIYSCPAPFARLVNQIGLPVLSQTLDLFRPYDQLVPENFAGFLGDDPPAAPVRRQATIEDAFGQGQITFTPLEMASIVAAIINGGNAPQPYMLMATREPGSETWTSANGVRQTHPITTPQTARQMQTIMRGAVENGVAWAAIRGGPNIGGYTSLAYSGDSTHVWFIGFAYIGAREGAVIALVIEDSDDLDLAASIGGEALRVAALALAPQQ